MDSHNGLCTNSLTDLTYDRHGNMWIGSYSGLMKYTGTGVKCFNKIGTEPDAISGPEMHSITEDRCGNIWVGTTAGLNKIDPITYQVEHFPIKSLVEGETSVGYIYSVFADKYDFVWVGTDVALFRFDSHTGNYSMVPVRNDSLGMPNYLISYNGYKEVDEGIWISTGAGMAYYDYASQTFYHHYRNPENKPVFANYEPTNAQSDIELDSKNRIWYVSSNKYLAWYDLNTEKFDSVSLPIPAGSWPCCHSVAADPHDRIWVGTRHGGVLIFDPVSRTFQSLRSAGPNRMIQSDYIYSIEQGPGGKMFVAHDNGLDIIDLYDTSVRKFKLSEADDFINMKYQSGDLSFDEATKTLFIPFYKYGLVTFRPEENQFTSYRSSNPSNDHYSLIYQEEGKTFASQDGNLCEVSIEKDTIVPKSQWLFPDTISGMRGNVVWCFKDAPDSYYFKKSSGRIFHVDHDSITIMRGAGFKPGLCISPDRKFLSYIADNYELVRIQLSNREVDTIPLQQYLQATTFSFSNVRQLRDDGHRIWMTGQNGILSYDYDQHHIYTYDISDGLSHTFTFSLVLDLQNNLWVGSIGGVDRYDRVEDKFKSIFKITDNIYMDAFGSALCTKEGILYFQFGNKLIEIQPALLSPENKMAHDIRLHEVKVSGLNVDWLTGHQMDKLSYQQNQISFFYDYPWFDDAALVHFEYKLNDGAWINNDDKNQINLDGLSNGRYVLRIKGTSGFQNQEMNMLVVPFRIHPPFWKSWWFISGLGLMMVGLFIYFFQKRIQRIKERSAMEIQMVRLKSTALKAQMNPHFVFNSLNAIQECIMTGRVEEAYTYLSKFSRLLRIVLEHADKPAIHLQEELEVLDLYLSLEQLRFKSDMQYEFHIDPVLDTEEIFLTPMVIQPHLENAVWHGLRHKQGSKTIEISFKEFKSNYLEVTVADNGIGREQATALQREKISAKHHRSMGSKLSHDQLSLLKQKYPETSMQIIDKKDDSNQSTGTDVILVLPILDSTAE